MSSSSSVPSGWDRYRQIRELGHGVHGRVVLCEDLHKKAEAAAAAAAARETQQEEHNEDDFLVAVKCVSLAGASEAESKAALREVAILTSVNHPNVLKFYSSFIDSSEQLCMVLEYVEGGDLSELISKMNRGTLHRAEDDDDENDEQQRGAFDDDFDCDASASPVSPSPRSKLRGRYFVDAIVVADIAEQLLKGLAHLHRNGVMHRDVKSQNVLLTRDGRVKIADFSISRVMTVRASSSQSHGGGNSSAAKFTPLTMAPEVASGLHPTFAADVWSMGVTLYELFLGEVPFNAGNLLALVAKICDGKYDERLLLARPYSGYVADESLNPSVTAKNISVQVQSEVCTAVCDIIRAALVLSPDERPTASQLLIRFFTEDNTDDQQQQQDLLSPHRAPSSSSSSSSAAAALREEVLSVVRSSCGSQLSAARARPLDCETDYVTIQSASNVTLSSTTVLSTEDDDSQRQGYEDDFEDVEDILSVSHKSIILKQQQQQQGGGGGGGAVVSASVAKTPTPVGAAKRQQQQQDDDDEREPSSTPDVESRISHLPWLMEAELFSHLPVDSRNGHDPIFFHAAGASVAEDPLLRAAEGLTEHREDDFAPSPYIPNNRYNNQHMIHRGSTSGLVVEMTPASAAAGRRRSSLSIGGGGSLTPSISTMSSLQSHLDPSMSSAASAALRQALKQQGGGLDLASATPAQQQAAVAAAEAAYSDQLKERIRSRAIIMHKKRRDSLAKERGGQQGEEEQQQQLAKVNDSVAQSLPHWASLPPPPKAPLEQQQQQQQQQKPPALSVSLLGQRRTAEDSKRELLALQERQEKTKRPSAVLTDIVDARARGLISGALMSAFPHIWKPIVHAASQERKQQQQSSPEVKKKLENEFADDEQDEEEEEEEEEEEIGDDEFKIKIIFSEATATKLQAVPFTGKTADAMQQPSAFPAFVITAILNVDAPYKELLKAVQDQVVFYGNAGGVSNFNGSMLLNGTGTGTARTLSASYKVLSACVPLEFGFHDKGGSGDRIVFSRRRDWEMMRDGFLEWCEEEGDGDSSAPVMELNALPR